MDQKGLSRKKYPSDLTDEQWARVSAMLPPAKQTPRGGRPRKVEMREGLNTLFYLHRSGCQWNRLPHDLLPKSTVYDSFAQWRDDGPWTRIVQAWRAQTRVAAGREPTPSAGCIASPSGKTTESGGPERGYDGGKQVKGRKRPILVDTWGFLIAVLITSAGLDDGRAAPQLLALISATACPRLVTICGDNKSHKHDLQAWLATQRPAWRLEVTTRPEGRMGFRPLRQRGVVERTNAWNGRDRRNSTDYERKPASSAVMIQMSSIHLMLNRLAPCPGPAFRYRQKAA
jgi:putative transposase